MLFLSLPIDSTDFKMRIKNDDTAYAADALVIVDLGSDCACWPNFNATIPAIAAAATVEVQISSGFDIPTREGFHSLHFGIYEVASSTYLYNFTIHLEVIQLFIIFIFKVP